MLHLFAQAAGRGNADAGAAGLGFMIIAMYCVGIVGSLVVAIMYFLSLSKALSRCRPRNRTMEPGQVWLMLIPVFGVVWQFFVVNRVSESIRKEFRSRGWHADGDCGASLGIWYCALNLSVCGSPAGFILWIMYWVKIAGFSKQLATGDAGGGDEDLEDEEEEDRPRRRRRADDEDDEDEHR